MFNSYLELFQAIHAEEPQAVKGQLIKEIVNCQLTLSQADMFADFVHRKLDYGYLAAQLAWYLRATPGQLDGIDAYSSAWNRIIEPDINSNYGIYVFTEMQWTQAVIARLRQDPSSRQALILFNRPAINLSCTADHICTTSMQFIIRKNALNAIVTMRSNDLWGGLCHDIPFFMMLQELTYVFLKESLPWLRRGLYHHNVGSLHAYEKDWAGIMWVANDPAREHCGMPPLESEADARKILTELGPMESMLHELAKSGIRRSLPAHKDRLGGAYPVFFWHIDKIIEKLCQIYSLPSDITPLPLPVANTPSPATKLSD
jgi:thymidylate synthase